MNFRLGWKSLAFIAAFSLFLAIQRAASENPWGAIFSAFCAGVTFIAAIDVFETDRARRNAPKVTIHTNAADFTRGMRRAKGEEAGR